MALPFRCHQNDESTERRRGGRLEIGDRERSVHAVPMRMRRLSGLELHFMRRSSSCIRSSDGTSSRFAAISAAAGKRERAQLACVGGVAGVVQQQLARSPGSGWVGGFVGLFLSGEVGPIEFSSMPFLFVFFLAFIYVGSLLFM